MKSKQRSRGRKAILRRDSTNRICLMLPANVGNSCVSARFGLCAVRWRLVDGLLRRFFESTPRPQVRLRAGHGARGATP